MSDRRFKVRVERTQVHDVSVAAPSRDEALTLAVDRARTETPRSDVVTARIAEESNDGGGAYL